MSSLLSKKLLIYHRFSNGTFGLLDCAGGQLRSNNPKGFICVLGRLLVSQSPYLVGLLHKLLDRKPGVLGFAWLARSFGPLGLGCRRPTGARYRPEVGGRFAPKALRASQPQELCSKSCFAPRLARYCSLCEQEHASRLQTLRSKVCSQRTAPLTKPSVLFRPLL